MIPKLMSLLARVASKPIDVVVFRGLQALNIVWLRRSGGWRRLSARARVISEPAMTPVLLYGSIPDLSDAQHADLCESNARIRASEFELFGYRVPDLEHCDFSEDWRFGHRWCKQYFKDYSFYERKQTPYDVKFPWELSRLAFIVPVIAHQVVNGRDSETIAWVVSILDRWESENPLAYSVNWYPMEASMRAINLVLMLDLARIATQFETDGILRAELKSLVILIARLLYKNAAFVWRTREYTDVRGNHFTANLVALYLAGLALSGTVGESARWRRYARMRIPKEIRLQFLVDGVNFEKACGYHKLVLELFALAAVAGESERVPLPADCLSLLGRAAVFSDAITRPDGLAANFGDTDDACAIPFTLSPARSHGAVVELLRVLTEKPLGRVRFPRSEALAAMFLVGRFGPTPPAPERPEISRFDNGGFYVVRDQKVGFFFITDLGEVGMAGRGGHGHNDILSFELFMDGNPVVQDPGCAGYTSDLDKKAWFRGTGAHATIQLFGAEMADLTSHWAISNHAKPLGVMMKSCEGEVTLSACHHGYSRIFDNSRVCRRFIVNPLLQALEIRDEISVERDDVPAAWHFPCGTADVQFRSGDVSSQVDIGTASMCAGMALDIVRAPFSIGYGQEVVGVVVRATASLECGTHHFQFAFRKT